MCERIEHERRVPIDDEFGMSLVSTAQMLPNRSRRGDMGRTVRTITVAVKSLFVAVCEIAELKNIVFHVRSVHWFNRCIISSYYDTRQPAPCAYNVFNIISSHV